ncbi:hypothetical protein BD769DRAFT_966174 [Suillus cothurnatus]|nr:hypothetical protein BD769DRAFT_966174 [Suillus cothurnatus]
MTVFHMQLRQDISLSLLFSIGDIDRFRGIPPARPNDDLSQPRKLWVCLEIILENFRQLSSIQQITHKDRSQVGFGNMTIPAEADDRCRLRVLLSTSKKKPSKPGMIMGEWFFNFRSLTAYTVHNRLQLEMKHKYTNWDPNHEGPIGTLYCTITPAPAFSSSERGQNILEQLPGPHPSNLSPGIFTIPDLSQTEPSTKKSPGLFPVWDVNPLKRRDESSSVLDLDLTFKEPDDIVKPELFIRRVFRDLKREIRLVTSVGVRHPARYIRDRRQMT